MAKEWSGSRPADEIEPSDDDCDTSPEIRLEIEPDAAVDKPVDDPVDPADPLVDHVEPEPGPDWTVRLKTVARQTLDVVVAAVVARAPTVWAALKPRLVRLAVTMFAGWLLWASFPTVNWWWAAVLAFVLLSWVLMRPATTPAGGLGFGFLFGLVFYLPLLPWISNLVGDVPWVALAMMSALFPALFGLFAVVVRRLPGWPLWFAVGWAAVEWLKSIIPFGGFPWGSVAFGQTDGPFLPLVQLGGVALLSAGIVLIGCCLTAIGLEIVKWWRAGGPKQSRRSGADADTPDPPPPAVMLPGLCLCLVLLAAIVVWPQVRRSGMGSGGEPGVTVAVVQGNVPRLGLDFNAQQRAVLDNHLSETMRLAEDVHSGAAVQPQFVIWPEDSSDIDPLVNADAGRQITEAADAVAAPIVIGTVLDAAKPDAGQPQAAPEYTNTVIVWNPVTGPAERHDKEIIQPFGEYLPMPWLFRHLSGYADRAGHFVPRPGSGVVHIGSVPVGVATCWEVIFDREPRTAVLGGAQLLAVPSNNATFNQTMSEQQLAFAKVRAVEHDRYVIVAGTVGISAVIAPDGRELARTDFFEPAYLDTQVRLKTRLTPATRWAPILQWILVATAGAAILLAIRHNGWSPRLNIRGFMHKGESEASDDSPLTEDRRDERDDDDYTPLHRSSREQPLFGHYFERYFARHRNDKRQR